MFTAMPFLQRRILPPVVARVASCRQSLCGVAALALALLLGGCAGVVPRDSPPYPRGDVADVGNPAGIKFYAQTEDGVFVLLADHVFPIRRGWADFGGAADSGETIEQTAAREAEEETRGYFKREDLLKTIAGQDPIFSGSYAFYFVEVDKVPAEDIGNHPVRGLRLAYRERGPYTWVPYSDIERYLEENPPETSRSYKINSDYLPGGWFRTSWYWPALVKHFRDAKAAGAIPWETSAN